ncbi:MAG: hypothetical protein RR382_02730 [Tannerellaceae bacterium]
MAKRVEVIIDAKDLLQTFDQLELRKQDAVLKAAYYKGASLIAHAAAYGMMGYFKGRNNSKKIYDMVNCVSYKYNKTKQHVTVFPGEGRYYGYMAKWFISGTKGRWAYTRESRKRKSGKMTIRKYKTRKKHYFGAIPGNNVIETAYNTYREKINEVIKEELESKLIKIWKKNGR